jgi:four helix bundle protein
MSVCPFELKKTMANCIDSGYSRRSVKEYLNFLNIALGSSGEFHSCIVSFHKADQISSIDYEKLDELHYKTENELLMLIKSLQKKMKNGDWDDTFKE